MSEEDKLLELANAAGFQGPWQVAQYGDGDSLVIHQGDYWRICFMATPGALPKMPARIESTADFIAACSPETVKALVEGKRELAAVATEAASLFRSYEAEHYAKAAAQSDSATAEQSRIKAQRNGVMAQKLEAALTKNGVSA